MKALSGKRRSGRAQPTPHVRLHIAERAKPTAVGKPEGQITRQVRLTFVSARNSSPAPSRFALARFNPPTHHQITRKTA